jgi:iron complex transport system ATP-binding protein
MTTEMVRRSGTRGLYPNFLARWRMAHPPALELVDVVVEREAVRALDGLTLTLESGRHLAVLGPNGSGKSTFVDLITRAVYPVQDRPGSLLRVFGRERWELLELRSLLGVVTNDLVRQCTRPVTALTTALSGFFGSVGLWPHHEVAPWQKARALEVLELLEVGHLADRLLTQLSSGEARRAVMARALVSQPRLLLLDEPMNSLDVRARREVRAAMRRLAAQGVSLLLVTHELEDIVPDIDRVVTLRAGRLLHDGPRAEVLRPGPLRALFGLELEVREWDGLSHAR